MADKSGPISQGGDKGKWEKKDRLTDRNALINTARVTGSSFIDSSHSEEMTDTVWTFTLCHHQRGGGDSLIDSNHWTLCLKSLYHNSIVDGDVSERVLGTTPGDEDLIVREWNNIKIHHWTRRTW